MRVKRVRRARVVQAEQSGNAIPAPLEALCAEFPAEDAERLRQWTRQFLAARDAEKGTAEKASNEARSP